MSELTAGGNLALPDTELSIRVPGPFDLSVLVTGDSGKVGGDGDFVFYNQPSAPGVRLLPGGGISVDPRGLRAGAGRLTVVVSAADPATPLGALPAPEMTVTGPGPGVLVRFSPARPTHETVLLLAEVYRRGPGWKLRALGQGYADGLAGIARDFGVDVAEEPAGPSAPAGPAPAAPHLTGTAAEFDAIVRGRRQAAGLPPLALDGRLTAAAAAHAAAMARGRRLGAEGPDGLSVFQRVTAGGYRWLRIEQHLVSGPRTAAEFVEYCLSDGVRRAPLYDTDLSDAGIGSATDVGSGETYWTALWARPFTVRGLAATVAEVLSRTNAERAAAGLGRLADDPRLTVAAQAFSTDMADRAFYSHTSPEGLRPWDRAAAAGARHRSIGENIACGQRSPREVVQGWMDSPGHRANILKPDFTHLGVGFADGGPAGTYWTQLFGRSG
ncbi:CAP domain-containing protein [Streptomyces sp. NPDC059092]|uniref:CAP domain-containing protein n=1 Tax=Streptomyces sp. NPDC059092 TaxID=3346725 RepID=UPI0036959B40